MNFVGQRTFTAAISLDNIKDQVAAFLYAMKVVHGDEKITDLSFFIDPNGDNRSIPISVTIEKDKEVQK